MYGCTSFDDSSRRTLAAAAHAPSSHAAVIVAHNGPSGLGRHPAALCGADFLPNGGDWGDPDLRSALDELHNSDRCGPMHAELLGMCCMSFMWLRRRPPAAVCVCARELQKEDWRRFNEWHYLLCDQATQNGSQLGSLFRIRLSIYTLTFLYSPGALCLHQAHTCRQSVCMHAWPALRMSR